MTPISPMHLAQGLITLIFTTLSAILGFFMIKRYFKYKEKQLLNVGLTWIFLTTAWWGDTFTFIFMLFGGDDFWLIDPIYFFIDNALLFPIFILWPRTMGELLLNDKNTLRKAFQLIVGIWGIICEIVFLALIFTNYKILGTRLGPFAVDWYLFVDSYIFLGSLVLLITGLIFSHMAMKSEKPAIRLKGKFLTIAFTLLAIGSILELIFVEIFVINFFARIIYICAAVFFYLGFVLPKPLRKRFGKNNN